MQPQRYRVGDAVTVVDTPVNCAFNWVKGMSEYVGRTAVVVDARLAHEGRDWRYEIDIDGRYYAWCENCFQETYIANDLPEFEVASVDAMLSLFS